MKNILSQQYLEPTHPWFYRKNFWAIRSKINSVLRWYDGAIIDEGVLHAFFDVYSNVDLGLTQEQRKDISMVMNFFMKRSLNSYRQWNSPNDELCWYDDGDFLSQYGSSGMIHDLSHAISRYIRNPWNQIDWQKFTPTIFYYEDRWFIEYREPIDEELFAFLWHKIFPKRHTMAKQVVWSSRDISDFYRKYLWEFLENTPVYPLYNRNSSEYIDQLSRADRLSLIERNTVTMNDLIVNPDPKLLELLQYIFDNQDNPRVMVDLFFREMDPLIEKLKKREPYTWEKRKNNINQNPPLS